MTEKFGKAMPVVLMCFALCMTGYSQSNSPQKGGNHSSQTTTTPSTKADRNQDTTAGSTNANAVAKAVENNLAAVELGKLAADKAENPRVKEFAETMVTEHTDALTKLSSVPGGNSTGVKLNAKHQQLKDRLSKLSGAQFDQAYMKAMITDQQEDIKFLEQQSARSTGKTAGGTDLQSIAQELLPPTRQHLQLAQEIEKELAATSKTKSNKKDQRSKPAPHPQK
jgi:putative membrane protein